MGLVARNEDSIHHILRTSRSRLFHRSRSTFSTVWLSGFYVAGHSHAPSLSTSSSASLFALGDILEVRASLAAPLGHSPKTAMPTMT